MSLTLISLFFFCRNLLDTLERLEVGPTFLPLCCFLLFFPFFHSPIIPFIPFLFSIIPFICLPSSFHSSFIIFHHPSFIISFIFHQYRSSFIIPFVFHHPVCLSTSCLSFINIVRLSSFRPSFIIPFVFQHPVRLLSSCLSSSSFCSFSVIRHSFHSLFVFHHLPFVFHHPFHSLFVFIFPFIFFPFFIIHFMSFPFLSSISVLSLFSLCFLVFHFIPHLLLCSFFVFYRLLHFLLFLLSIPLPFVRLRNFIIVRIIALLLITDNLTVLLRTIHLYITIGKN
jgi:hypothetical protein